MGWLGSLFSQGPKQKLAVVLAPDIGFCLTPGISLDPLSLEDNVEDRPVNSEIKAGHQWLTPVILGT
jgi:hypothetical protein